MNCSTRTVFAFAVMLTAALSPACGDSDSESNGPDAAGGAGQVTVDDFVGSWQASSAVFTNNADANEQYAVIENGGEMRMTVLTGGGARTWTTIGDTSDEWDAQLAVDGSTVTSTPVEATRLVRSYEFTLDGDALTLVNTNDEFDFTGTDATPVSATVHIEMTRQ